MSRLQGKLPEAENGDTTERVLQILSTSARLFATSGYDGTSMRDIAEAWWYLKVPALPSLHRQG